MSYCFLGRMRCEVTVSVIALLLISMTLWLKQQEQSNLSDEQARVVAIVAQRWSVHGSLEQARGLNSVLAFMAAGEWMHVSARIYMMESACNCSWGDFIKDIEQYGDKRAKPCGDCFVHVARENAP